MKKFFLISIIVFLYWQMLAGQSSLEKLHRQITQTVDKKYTEWDQLYKYLHQHPEISFHEKNTAGKLASELKSIGFEVTENVGGYGVVGILKNGEGPVVLIRSDMDALPLEEKTGLPYASKAKTADDSGNEVSVMHACGHDIHMTTLIGTAYTLHTLRKGWKGTLIIVGQPAEERGSGAKAMIADNLFTRFPTPDYALALHCNATIPAGKVGYCEGYALANVDMIDIVVHGTGGHGAYPHTTVDPIVLASNIVTSLQTIVSRELAPTEPAVVTVGSFHSGTKHNIIPDKAHLQLTLRSYTDEARAHILSSIRRICKNMALGAGVPEGKLPEIIIQNESIPSTYNQVELTRKMKKTSRKVLGKENIIEMEAVMGGEDFGLYGRTDEKIPICIYWLGTVDPVLIEKNQKEGTPLPSLHSPFFAPVPQPSIKTGVKTMTANALQLFLN